MDPGRAPQWIFTAHSLDEITQASVNPRPPCPIARLPAPVHSKSSAVPSQNRLRLDHPHRAKKAPPELSHPYKQDAIAAAKPETRSWPPKSDVELMAKKQVFGFKPTARLEQVDGKHSERVEDRKHRSQ
jgi:hypothetical protein